MQVLYIAPLLLALLAMGSAKDALKFLLCMLFSGSLGAYLALRLLGKRISKKRAITNNGPYTAATVKQDAVTKVAECGELDPRRKWAIVTGGATDHAGEVCVVSGPQDLSQTIFKDMTGVKATVMKSAVCVELFWNDSSTQRISKAFASVPRAPCFNQGILDFMETECNFKVEHADGSFMDHLQFCYEYGHAHYSKHSPRVLFLHSIMGVGTNVFPMALDKVPKLKGMVTDEEFQHIQAFPSLLRLLYNRSLLEELTDNLERLDSLKGIKFHRVIDNEELTLTASELWVALNYQVCHQLDFLPVSNWIALQSNSFLSVFRDIFNFLQTSNKLEAHVNFDWTSGERSSEGLPVTLGGLIQQRLPEGVAKALGRKQIQANSKLIGHSLNYQLLW